LERGRRSGLRLIQLDVLEQWNAVVGAQRDFAQTVNDYIENKQGPNLPRLGKFPSPNSCTTRRPISGHLASEFHHEPGDTMARWHRKAGWRGPL
jgi:hypothetical protein